MISDDGGMTWRTLRCGPLALPVTADDGWIVGSFTDQQGSNLTTDHSSRVYFFRLPADREGKG
jgi:hypothetical protein